MADIDQTKVVPDEIDPSRVRIDPPEPERGMVSKFGRSLVRGGAEEAVGTFGKGLALAASTPFILADRIRGAITGDENDTRAQDFAFRNLVDPTVRLAESFAPTAEEVGSVAQSVARGLGGLAVDLPLIALTGAKAGLPEAVASGARAATAIENAARAVKAITPVAAAQGIRQTETAAREGVDLPTAYGSGLTAAATTVAGGIVPLAAPGGLLTRAATGAVSGAATGELGRQAQNAVLGDYENLQTPLTATEVATGAATGALLGAALGPRSARRTTAPLTGETAPGTELPPLLLDNVRGTQNPLVQFPDGSVGTRIDAENYINAFPEEQRAAVRAGLFGYGPENVTGTEFAQRFVDQARRAPEEGLAPGEITPIDQFLAEERGSAVVAGRLAQAGAAENAGLVETVTATNQKHAEDIATLRDAGEVPTGDPVRDASRALALHENPPAPSAAPVSDRLNTQLQDALMEAQRGSGKAKTQAAFEQAETDAAAARERELTAIQNIARGEEQAAVAARGEVPANTAPMAVSHTEFLNKLTEVKPEDQNLPPRLKQEITQAVRGKDTYPQQLDALSTLRNGKNRATASYELLDRMVKDLVPEPPAAPEIAPVPAAEAPATAEPTARDRAQAAADQLDATITALQDQKRSGTPLEANAQARLDEARDLRSTMSRVLATNTASDDYLADLTNFANNTATQQAYDAQGPRLAFKAASPEEIYPALDQLLRNTDNVDTVLGFLKDNGSAQWVKDLAGKLADFGLDTRIAVSNDARGFDPGTVGAYSPTLREARFFEGGASEHTTLHEIVHAATYDQVDQAAQMYAPRNQAEAAKRQAYFELENVRQEAAKKATVQEHYGLTNIHEFIAELNTNPEFQAFLSKKSLWQKTVDLVRRVLGLPSDARTMLEKAMSLQGEFFGKEQYQAAQEARKASREFNESPKQAADVTDTTLAHIFSRADEDKPGISLSALSRRAFDNLLKWQTTQYIADRVATVPEMVQSGFHNAVAGYERAYKTRNLANEYAEKVAVKYGTDLEHKLHAMKPEDARILNQTMSEISTGSSIGGFDPTLNFDQNKAVRPGLQESNKGYVNEIYRKFKQLEKSDPAAAKAIVDGAKVNRKGYVLDQATVVSNLMRAAGDTARKLEADLRLMAPDDAARAQAEARLAGATAEANFGINNAAGLDFMAKDVQNAHNTNPKQHIDGASAILDQRLRNVFANARQLPEDSVLRQQLQEIEGPYLNQIENPYYHAGRSGDYFVKFAYRNMDQATWDRMQGALKNTNKVLGDFSGHTHAFMRFESLEQAQAAYKKLTAAAGDKFVAPDSASGKLAEGGLISNNAGISAALRSALATLHDSTDVAGLSGEQAAAMKDALTRKFLQLLPESSTRLATIKRMGVPGYDGDFLGSYAKRAGGSVSDTANIYALRSYADAFKGMDQSIDQLARTGTPEVQARAQSVADEIKTRYHNSMQPVQNDLVNLANSFGHSFYLALSPAYLIRSMAQPLHRAVPIMGARYGFVNSAKELAGATGAAMRVMENSIRSAWSAEGVRGVLDADLNLDGVSLSDADRVFVQEMHDRGILKLGQARQLQNLVVGGNPKLRDLARTAAMTIQYSDMVNRLSTGLAAFRLAQKQGGRSVEANTDYALKVVDNSMDNFDPNNTARAIGKHGVAGKVTPLFSAFLNYNFQTMQQIARTVHDGLFNRDTSPEGKVRAGEARRELGGLMATTAMLSGAMGLPFVSAFAGVYNTLFQDEDQPSDIRQSARNFLADNLGTDIGSIVAHGAGGLVGVDTSSFGLQDLLPGSQFLADRRLFKDKVADNALSMWGPSINAFVNIGKGLTKVADGQYVKGIEDMLPSGLKGFWKAYEIAQYGYTDAKGNPIGVPSSPWDVAIQATGIRPQARAEASEAANYFNINQERLNARRALILDNLYKGVRRKEPGLVQTATQQIREFNRANPLQPINDVSNVLAQRAVQEKVGELTGGIKAPVRRIPVIRDDIRFTDTALPQF